MALSEGRPVPQDLLGVLLTAADESGQALNDEELWEDVHDVMGAGEMRRLQALQAHMLVCVSLPLFMLLSTSLVAHHAQPA